jgi:hypothetical protein
MNLKLMYEPNLPYLQRAKVIWCFHTEHLTSSITWGFEELREDSEQSIKIELQYAAKLPLVYGNLCFSLCWTKQHINWCCYWAGVDLITVPHSDDNIISLAYMALNAIWSVEWKCNFDKYTGTFNKNSPSNDVAHWKNMCRILKLRANKIHKKNHDTIWWNERRRRDVITTILCSHFLTYFFSHYSDYCHLQIVMRVLHIPLILVRFLE